MPERQANRESQDAADRGEQRHPGPYPDAEEVMEQGGSIDSDDARRREFRAVTGEEPPEAATSDDLRAPEERTGLGATQRRPVDDTGEG